jgi:kynureninase
LNAALDAARALDAADPLTALSTEFCHPLTAAGQRSVYLCGHSLGLAPRSARVRVSEEMDDWERLAVDGHHIAQRPWIDYADHAIPGLAALTGARPHELVAMNSLSVNLHLLMASFYRPLGARRRILIEAGAFSSDRHAVAAQIAWHGLDPDSELVEVRPEGSSATLDAAQIDAAIEREGERLALVLWPGVQYRTGQAFDCGAHRAQRASRRRAGRVRSRSCDRQPAARSAWRRGGLCRLVQLQIPQQRPGAIGGAFVHERHAAPRRRASLAGGVTNPRSRFKMLPGFVPARGAAGWAVSNPPILSCAPLLASLDIFQRVGMPALRARSQRLTGYFARLLQEHCGGIEIVTPEDALQRGCQLSLRFATPGEARRQFEALHHAGVICDLREPDLLRAAPAPLYNGYADVCRFVQALAAGK